ncbi:hypothetical protein RJ640_009677 [Escallonia rubra]|uniref:Transcription termination factor MTEF18, mitochondrial-like n=1 Tax=Escallonia rubra TaxID=112253 RepID=A0AA88UGF5_9ASTE|nr:hypothetical protein RJ640_009677 [Escallonia rubra]
MLIRGISKRASVITKMISQLNQMFLFPPIHGKPSTTCTPSFASLTVRCFRCSGPAHNPKLSHIEPTQTPISVTGNRISRVARTEAQVAFFDYLHCTRGFPFTDAEHISKNSPNFLQSLLSKVDTDQDVSRALSKFFRYHPVNEFEPFLESLGLAPHEFQSLLPRDLMFLVDDDVLLENFHLLCDYGIPRSKIGKMYKDATAIFRYEHGVMAMKLRAYEDLGLSRSTVIKLVSCCPSLLVGGVNDKFVGVLEKLKGLGFGSDWIGRYLSYKSAYKWNRMLDTMSFLTEVGYNETQMGVLFKMNPALLLEGSGKRIYILVCRLLKLGLKMNQVYALFLKNPQALSEKFAKNLWKAVYFLFEIGMDTAVIANIVTAHMQLLGLHTLKGPRTVWQSLEVDRYTLRQIIQEDPLKLISLASKNTKAVEQTTSRNPNRLLEKTTFLLSIGYTENSDEMAKALKKFRGRGDQLQERFDCLVRAGLDCNDVSSMIKQAPSALNQTKDVLERKIDCLRNCLGYPLESIVAFPSYLCYDMDRIIQRLSMYVWLRKRGAAKPMLSLSTLLACSDTRFVRYFVHVDPEGPAMWESLKTSLPSN